MLIKTFCGLFEMIFGLVNVSFSLPEWQAGNLDPTLSLVATNAAFQFWRKRRGCWESNWMKYSSNLADYWSLSQSSITGQVYIEQEHVFIIIPNSF